MRRFNSDSRLGMILSQGWAVSAGDFDSSSSLFEMAFLGSQIPVFVAIRASQSYSKSIGLTAVIDVLAASCWMVLFLASFRLNAYDPSGVLFRILSGALWLASAVLMVAADIKAFGLLRNGAKSRQAFGDFGKLVGWLSGIGMLLQLAVLAVAYEAIVALTKSV